MSEQSVREQVSDFLTAQMEDGGILNERLEEIEESLHQNNRLRNLALATAIVCLAAAMFSAGYALTSRQQLHDAKVQLAEQIQINQRVVCSSARSTALAFREPQVSADGTSEPRGHFINRMLAQKVTLKLAIPLHCSELPGFATFPFLRAKALYEIEMVLHEANPERFAAPKGVNPLKELPGQAKKELEHPTGNGAAKSGEPTATTTTPSHSQDLPPPTTTETTSSPSHENEQHHHPSHQHEERHEGHESTGGTGGEEVTTGGSSGGGEQPAGGSHEEVATGSGSEEVAVTPPAEEEAKPEAPKAAAKVELLPPEGGVGNVELPAVEGVGVCLPGLLKLNCRE